MHCLFPLLTGRTPIMDALQQKVISLHEKVDALHGLVEHTHQMVLALFGQAETIKLKTKPDVLTSSTLPAIASDLPAEVTPSLEPALVHKDVLPDAQGWEQLPDYNTGEQSLSPELQIRRLTAQVTAAYSRIAALEEQLLARRQSNTVESESFASESRWPRSRP